MLSTVQAPSEKLMPAETLTSEAALQEVRRIKFQLRNEELLSRILLVLRGSKPSFFCLGTSPGDTAHTHFVYEAFFQTNTKQQYHPIAAHTQ